MATRIRWRRGTAAEWTTANPILALGEGGIEIAAIPGGVPKTKIGDGVLTWTQLPYATSGVISDNEALDAQIAALIAADASIQSASVKALPLFTATAATVAYTITALNGKTVVLVRAGSAILDTNQYSLSGTTFTFLNLAFPFEGGEEIQILYTG